MENSKKWFLNHLLNKNYSIEFVNFQLFCGPDIVLYNCEIKNGGHRLTFSIVRLKLVKICIFSKFCRPIGRADNLTIIHYAPKRWTRAWCRMPNSHFFFRNHKHDVTWSCDFPQDFTHSAWVKKSIIKWTFLSKIKFVLWKTNCWQTLIIWSAFRKFYFFEINGVIPKLQQI